MQYHPPWSGGGLLQYLVLILTPPEHDVTSQEDGCHGPQWPSLGANMKKTKEIK